MIVPTRTRRHEQDIQSDGHSVLMIALLRGMTSTGMSILGRSAREVGMQVATHAMVSVTRRLARRLEGRCRPTALPGLR
jgi:hypothetical protein